MHGTLGAGAVLLLILTTPACFPVGLTQKASTLGAGKFESGAEFRYMPSFGGAASWTARGGVSDAVDVGARVTANFTNLVESTLELQTKFQLTPRSSRGVFSIAPMVNASFNGMGGQLSFLTGVKLGPHELVFTPHFALMPFRWDGYDRVFLAHVGVGGSVGFYAQIGPHFRMMPELGIRVLPWGGSGGQGSMAPVTGEIALALLFGNS